MAVQLAAAVIQRHLFSMASSSRAPGRPDGLEAANEAIWGQRSLLERFGEASGRQLQEKIFSMYEVRLRVAEFLACD